MARIGVDVDDTLYSFADLSRRVLSELAEERNDSRLRNASYASWDEWRSPCDLAGGKAWEEVIDICHSPKNIGSQMPFVGAAEVLWDLRHAGHELVYVSNRNSSTLEPTKQWLEDNGFPVLAAEVLCHREDKLPSIRDCQYLIDDRPKTLVGFVHAQWGSLEDLYVNERGMCLPKRKAFGLVTPYNRGLTDVPDIYLAPSWPLLGRYLVEKIA